MKPYLIVLLAAVGIFTVGRFSAPKKVETKIVDRVVTVEREVTKKDRATHTKRREITLPDGTKTVEIERSTDTRTTTEKKNTTTRDTESSIRTTSRPNYRVGVLYTPPLFNQKDSYALVIERRMFAEIYAGVFVTTQKQVGLSVSISF